MMTKLGNGSDDAESTSVSSSDDNAAPQTASKKPVSSSSDSSDKSKDIQSRSGRANNRTSSKPTISKPTIQAFTKSPPKGPLGNRLYPTGNKLGIISVESSDSDEGGVSKAEPQNTKSTQKPINPFFAFSSFGTQPASESDSSDSSADGAERSKPLPKPILVSRTAAPVSKNILSGSSRSKKPASESDSSETSDGEPQTKPTSTAGTSATKPTKSNKTHNLSNSSSSSESDSDSRHIKKNLKGPSDKLANVAVPTSKNKSALKSDGAINQQIKLNKQVESHATSNVLSKHNISASESDSSDSDSSDSQANLKAQSAIVSKPEMSPTKGVLSKLKSIKSSAKQIKIEKITPAANNRKTTHAVSSEDSSSSSDAPLKSVPSSKQQVNVGKDQPQKKESVGDSGDSSDNDDSSGDDSRTKPKSAPYSSSHSKDSILKGKSSSSAAMKLKDEKPPEKATLSSVFPSKEFEVDNSPSIMYVEDLESGDEVWLMQTPKEVTKEVLMNQKLKLGGTSMIKTDDGAAGDCEFEVKSFRHDRPHEKTCLLRSRESNAVKAVLLSAVGQIVVRRTLAVPEPSPMFQDEPHRIPLPQGLKVRHPLFGADYDKLIQERDKSRDDPYKVSGKKSKKKEREKTDVEQVRCYPSQSVEEPSGEGMKKAKKKETRQEREQGEDVVDARVHLGNEESSTKRKKKHRGSDISGSEAEGKRAVSGLSLAEFTSRGAQVSSKKQERSDLSDSGSGFASGRNAPGLRMADEGSDGASKKDKRAGDDALNVTPANIRLPAKGKYGQNEDLNFFKHIRKTSTPIANERSPQKRKLGDEESGDKAVKKSKREFEMNAEEKDEATALILELMQKQKERLKLVAKPRETSTEKKAKKRKNSESSCPSRDSRKVADKQSRVSFSSKAAATEGESKTSESRLKHKLKKDKQKGVIVTTHLQETVDQGVGVKQKQKHDLLEPQANSAKMPSETRAFDSGKTCTEILMEEKKVPAEQIHKKKKKKDKHREESYIEAEEVDQEIETQTTEEVYPKKKKKKDKHRKELESQEEVLDEGIFVHKKKKKKDKTREGFEVQEQIVDEGFDVQTPVQDSPKKKKKKSKSETTDDVTETWEPLSTDDSSSAAIKKKKKKKKEKTDEAAEEAMVQSEGDAEQSFAVPEVPTKSKKKRKRRSEAEEEEPSGYGTGSSTDETVVKKKKKKKKERE